MKKRYALVMLIIVIGLIVVGLALMATNLFFSKPFLYGSGMFCIAAAILYSGLWQLRLAKTSGTPIFWWKHYQIVLALFFFCFGGLYFLQSVHHIVHVSETIQTIAIILYATCTFGVGIYGIVLTFQFAAEQRKKRRDILQRMQ